VASTPNRKTRAAMSALVHGQDRAVSIGSFFPPTHCAKCGVTTGAGPPLLIADQEQPFPSLL
jgi:hypothetical protein